MAGQAETCIRSHVRSRQGDSKASQEGTSLDMQASQAGRIMTCQVNYLDMRRHVCRVHLDTLRGHSYDSGLPCHNSTDSTTTNIKEEVSQKQNKVKQTSHVRSRQDTARQVEMSALSIYDTSRSLKYDTRESCHN